MPTPRVYIAIDLKSFYASVECVERGLDPLTTNLVVADESRTEKTICLAVSPSLKARGIGGRARLFEVLQRVRREDFIAATPRMSLYLDYSQRVYNVYLKYIAPEDIHVYSVDEVFMDVTSYLNMYRMTAHELAMTMIRDVLRTTGITATAGIGPNLYLAKIAMDIVAKHIPADADGVRIAELDEMSYRRQLWDHKPLTSFWRVGRGIADRLAPYGIDTMGKIARQSLKNEELLYKLFGVEAELIIDHAWGYEPCTIADIRAYRPETHSTSSGQVLAEPYSKERARTVVREMADGVSLSLISKKLVTNQLVLHISYEQRGVKSAHGTANLDGYSSSSRAITEAVLTLYDRIVDAALQVRRLNISACHVIPESEAARAQQPVQLDLFADYNRQTEQQDKDVANTKERRMQQALLAIKSRFGKNAILRGTDFKDGATTRQRNTQIGGHKA